MHILLLILVLIIAVTAGQYGGKEAAYMAGRFTLAFVLAFVGFIGLAMLFLASAGPSRTMAPSVYGTQPPT